MPLQLTVTSQQLTTVDSGVRFVGVNVRKGYNRRGPGLFDLTLGKVTVVIADQDFDMRPVAHSQQQPVATKSSTVEKHEPLKGTKR